MATIAQLAPTLIAAGFTPRELRVELRPKNAPPPPQAPKVQKKRYEQAVRLLAKFPGMSDEEVATKVTTITPEIVAAIRAEVASVVAQLSGLDPVDEGTNPDDQPQDATTNGSTNRVVKSKHELDDGTVVTIVELSGTTGLDVGRPYYLVNANGNNFQLSDTVGGDPVDFTGNGTCKYVVVT